MLSSQIQILKRINDSSIGRMLRRPGTRKNPCPQSIYALREMSRTKPNENSVLERFLAKVSGFSPRTAATLLFLVL
jgi:hypothetical protein